MAFTVYGTYEGRPAWCTYEDGKVTSDPPEVAEKVLKWVDLIKRSEIPLPAEGMALFRLSPATAHFPLTYLILMKRVMKVERREGEVPNEIFLCGVPWNENRKPYPKGSVMEQLLF